MHNMKLLKKYTKFQKNMSDKTMESIADRLLDLDNIMEKRNEQASTTLDHCMEMTMCSGSR